jgi:hypothetical protein
MTENFLRGEDIDNTHKTAFSKWFSYFGELRSICPSATLLVLRLRNLEETEFEISRNKRNNTLCKVKNIVWGRNHIKQKYSN